VAAEGMLISRMSSRVGPTDSIQYSVVCHQPRSRTGWSSFEEPRPAMTAPAIHGVCGVNSVVLNKSGWLWPTPFVLASNGFAADSPSPDEAAGAPHNPANNADISGSWNWSSSRVNGKKSLRPKNASVVSAKYSMASFKAEARSRVYGRPLPGRRSTRSYFPRVLAHPKAALISGFAKPSGSTRS
jgi:hypothetical protein